MTKIQDTKHNVSQCKVVLYSWEYEVDVTTSDLSLLNAVTPEGTLSNSKRYDLSSRIKSVNFTKSLNNPSGNFSFSLANVDPSIDQINAWNDIIKPGMWVILYMTQNGDLDLSANISNVSDTDPSKIRCIGYIDRVATRSDLNEVSGSDISFEVSGRDFGCIYEDTQIWLNMFRYEKTLLDTIANSKIRPIANVKVSEAIEVIHDLFFNAKNLSSSASFKEIALTELSKQWLLPSKMIDDLGIDFFGSSFIGNLDILKASETSSTVSISSPIDFLQGDCWSKLKEISIPQFHELFCETADNGKMELIFRPIPWAIDKSKYPKAGKFIDYFVDIPRVLVNAIDELSFDIGKDNHNRKNNFIVYLANALYGPESNITALRNSKFPLQIRDSIKRHGFRPSHVSVNALTYNEMKNDGKANKVKLIEYNNVLLDYWKAMIHFESGNLEKDGSNDVKIGKVIEFAEDVPNLAKKLFYIEEYTDTFIVEPGGVDTWRQSLQLTHGEYAENLKNKSNLGKTDPTMQKTGEFTKHD